MLFSFLSFLMKVLRRNQDDSSNPLKSSTRLMRKSLEDSGEEYNTNAKENGIIESGNESDLDSRKISARILDLLTAVIAFFESMMIFLAAITWGVYLLVALLIVIVIIIVLSLLNIATQAGKTSTSSFGYNPHDVNPVASSSTKSLSWTNSQLSSAGATLTGYEKNLYRTGILANKAIQGYGGSPLLTGTHASQGQLVKMLMGIGSIENGMEFYSGSQTQSITKVPTNVIVNSGYVFFGVSRSQTLSSYYNSQVVSKIKSAYTPSSSPVGGLANYAPYGIAMSANHLQINLRSAESDLPEIKSIASQWGIKANLSQFETFTELFLADAMYHTGAGGVNGYSKDLINFYAALFCATSPTDDSKRSFYDWTEKTSSSNTEDFSESSLRPSFYGDGTSGGDILSGASEPTSLSGTGRTKILLNGVTLTKPVWSYLGNLYDSTSHGSTSTESKGFLSAWQEAKHYSNMGIGTTYGQRVLDFEYGFNAFLQGNAIESLLAKKMSILLSSSGGFKVTPGQGQAVINGSETTMQYLNKWKSSSHGSSKLYNYIVNTLKPAWGTSAYISNPKDPAKIGGTIAGSHSSGYVDKVHGTPFYGQDGYGVNYGETYSNIHWYPGINDTFATTGCMTYATAYAASALTGKLINPTEMDSIMLTTKAIVSQGIVMSRMPQTYALLGLQSKLITGGSGAWGSSTDNQSVGYDIASTVKAGGVAILFTDKHPFTGGTHFVALTAVEHKNGVDEYSIFSSPRFDQSEVPWSKSVLLNAEVKSEPVLLVWK